ncbi:MAG: SPOR domain-containing protein [Candidatus Omnitrophica bacterium]|nr:SPOR domain-containing protein [Candidatus Omnitrophota bacterium]
MDEKQLYLFDNITNNSLKRRYVIALPLDTIVLMSVIIVLLLIFSYSIGVERGKKIVYSSSKEMYMAGDFSAISSKADLANINSDSSKLNTNTKKSEQAFVEPITNNDTHKEYMPDTYRENEKSKDFANETNPKNKYVIQVASYQNEIIAKNELEKLKRQGYPVFISKRGKFIVIFVGEFSNKDTAKKHQQVLQKIYSDCLLRTL